MKILHFFIILTSFFLFACNSSKSEDDPGLELKEAQILGQIKGKLIDSKGRPLVNAKVQIGGKIETLDDGSPSLSDGQTTYTDESGEFVFDHVLVQPEDKEIELFMFQSKFSISQIKLKPEDQLVASGTPVQSSFIDGFLISLDSTELNHIPQAKMSEEFSLLTGQLVTVDGIKSEAIEGISAFSWQIVNKPEESQVTLQNNTESIIGFIPDIAGEYEVELVVTDKDGDSTSDSQTFIVDDDKSSPVAKTKRYLQVLLGQEVLLDASPSFDADGDELTYKWRSIDTGSFVATRPDDGSNESNWQGNVATLTHNSFKWASFVAEEIGEYQFELVVSDGENDSIPTIVEVDVVAQNVMPVADVNEDQVVMVDQRVQLNGSLSYDFDNDGLFYHWQFVTVPEDSQAALSFSTSTSPNFYPDIPGEYLVSLVVSDGIQYSEASYVRIIVLPEPLVTVSMLSINGDFIRLESSHDISLYRSSTVLSNGPVSLASFRLHSVGDTHTLEQVVNFQEENNATGYFEGIEDGQTLSDGESVSFELMLPKLHDDLLNSVSGTTFSWQFSINESGQSFIAKVTFP